MRKINFYKLKFKIISIIITIILIFGLIMLFPHFFRNTYVVTIASKQVKNQGNGIQYLIYTQVEDGTIRAFKDTNSIIEFKFGSEDIYRGLRINRKYKIKTYGIRIIPFSSYENIIEAQQVK
ncbi:DUF1523 domain-containing protein [Clostridium sp. WILCCON 0269]|uniref:DUF1523 domain-containing protein n=1 Tax=Candidatus Clostridium eludens TaxID=3381663 RepID=A0ABW8SLX7_9CLOT